VRKIRLDLGSQRGTVEGLSGTYFTHCGACYTMKQYGGCSNSNSQDYHTCLAGCEVTEAPQNSCAALVETGCC
jgi:hypothetical protein